MAKCKKCGIQMSNFEFFTNHNECDRCAMQKNYASITEKMQVRDMYSDPIIAENGKEIKTKKTLSTPIFFILSVFFPLILVFDALSKRMKGELIFYLVGYPLIAFLLVISDANGAVVKGTFFSFTVICAAYHSAVRGNY